MFNILKRLKNIICFFLIIILTAIAFIFYKNYYLFLFLFSIIIFAFITIILSIITVKTLKLSLNIKQVYTEKNTPIDIEFYISNASPIPLINCCIEFKVYNNFYENSKIQILDFSLLGFLKNQKVILPINSENAGMINIEVLKIKSNDMLNFFGISKKLNIKKSVCIIPEKINIEFDDSNLILNDGSGISKESIDNSGDEFININKFKDGDNIRNIHWKLSVKKNELMVKEFGEDAGDRITIFVDLVNYKNNNELDCILDTAYSVCCNFINKNKTFFISWKSDKFETLVKKEVLQYDDLLEAFEQIYYQKPYNEKTFISKEDINSVIIVTAYYMQQEYNADIIGKNNLAVILKL